MIYCILLLVIFVIYIAYHRLNTKSTQNEIVLQWVYHLLYTRLVIGSFFTDKETNKLSARLIKNQEDIANLFKKKYGKLVAQNIHNKLIEHIQIAVDVFKNHDNKLDINIKRFYDNADEIGIYLDKILKSGSIFQKHMKNHIDYLIKDITSYLSESGENLDYLDDYISMGISMGFDMSKYM